MQIFGIKGLLTKVSQLSHHKDSIGVIKDLFTILAIIVAGYWTLMLYQTYREDVPRLSIEHSVSHRILSPQKVLLIVDVTTTNTGKILIKPLVGFYGIDKILPLSDDRLAELKLGELDPKWETLFAPKYFQGLDKKSERFLEPNEGESQHLELVLDSSIKTIRIYSFFESPKNKALFKFFSSSEDSIGWEKLSIYDLQDARNAKAKEQ